MISIQSGMLVALGFLAAMLLGLLVAPAFWARAVRLTTKRLKESLPLSEMEIEADRDRIRAEYAIKMHKLETLVEQVKFAAARQQIEINRRDARVNMLEADLESVKASYEEAQNARRVLEQTIADRMPRVEARLTDAQKLLYARDRAIDELTHTADRQKQALAEASSINAQKQSEIERLSTSLAARAARASAGNAPSESEAALRAELESLRAKTREQSQLLARLQSLAGRSSAAHASAQPAVDGPATATAAGDVVAPGHDPARAGLEQQLRNLRARNDDQAGEIARLKAAISVFEREDESGKASIRESRIGLKARVQALEAQTTQQTEIIQKLRGELAAANERLARQADHFTGELRRLGTTGGSRARRQEQPRPARASLAERVAQAHQSSDEPTGPEGREPQLVSAADRPMTTPGAVDGSAKKDKGSAETSVGPVVEREKRSAAVSPEPAAGSEPELVAAASGSTGRPRLLDRIAGLSRGS